MTFIGVEIVEGQTYGLRGHLTFPHVYIVRQIPIN